MANKAGRHPQEFQEYFMFVERFTHDVLEYTLTKCGLPESSLPTTDCAKNIYHRTDFLKIAGASVLRISLAMRDKWKQMFKSRRNRSEFNDENILEFMRDVTRCYRTSRTCPAQSLVELLLALCNEIMLYFHFGNIDIDFKNIFKKISGCILYATAINRNDPEKLEELFDSFDDISGYTKWISDFISRFAVPYGSRDDVSDPFFRHVREKFEDDLKKLKNSLRFLPLDLFSSITDGISENLAESTSILSDSKSLEPPKFSTDSEIGALGGEDSLGNLSTCTDNVSEHLSENKQSCKISSAVGIEQDWKKMRLDVKETSHETQGAKTKPKKSKKGKGKVKNKGSENLAESTSIPSDSKSLEPPKLTADSEMGTVGGKKSENLAESTSIPSDSKSLDPPKLPTDSEMGALGSGSTGTENISELSSQNEISKLEQRVAAESSKTLAKIISISNDRESMEPQKVSTGSEIDAEVINKSLGSLSTCTENVSEHLAEKNQSSDISSEVAIEHDLRKTSLDVEGTSPEIHGVKKKSKITKKEKDIGKRKLILVLSSFLGYAFLVMCFKIYTSK